MSIMRTEEGLVCEECGSDRAGYACGSCQELICSCSIHICPAQQEAEEQARWEYEQREFEERQEQERNDFYGRY